MSVSEILMLLNERENTMCSHTFTLFRSRKASVIVGTFQLSLPFIGRSIYFFGNGFVFLYPMLCSPGRTVYGSVSEILMLLKERENTMCSHTFTLFRSRKTHVIVETFQLSFRVFMCLSSEDLLTIFFR